MTEALGWLSSVVLLLTIGKQVYKQWQSRSVEGVSKYLFVGQIAASAGFTLYSVLVHNWVFVVTNALMLASAIVGVTIYVRNVRSVRRTSGSHSARSEHGEREARENREEREHDAFSAEAIPRASAS